MGLFIRGINCQIPASSQPTLAAPHVAIWWNERLDLAGIEAKIGPRIDGSEPAYIFAIEQEGSESFAVAPLCEASESDIFGPGG